MKEVVGFGANPPLPGEILVISWKPMLEMLLKPHGVGLEVLPRDKLVPLLLSSRAWHALPGPLKGASILAIMVVVGCSRSQI